MYMAVCAALIKLRRQKEKETFYKVPFGWALALGGIAISVYLLTKTEWQELRDFLLVAGACIAVYFIQKGKETFTKQ